MTAVQRSVAGRPGGVARRGALVPVGRLALYLALTAVGATMALPAVWALLGSIKTSGEVVGIPPVILPEVAQWDNYVRVWQIAPFGTFFLNTLTITAVAGISQIASTALVGYGFARFRFPGREPLFMLVLSTMMLPSELTMVPLFIIYKTLGWLNSFLPLTVPYFFGVGPFFIFLFRQYFLTIPYELDEAARMDGATDVRIFASLIVPLSMPAFAAAAIISFLGHWNDFVGPLIYLNTPEKFTLSLGLHYFRQGGIGGVTYEPRDHLLMAATAMSTAPVVAVFFMAQRYFIQGVVMSGLKL